MISMMQSFSRSLAAAALASALIASGDAVAQGAMSGVPNAMQGFSQNRDQPIQIEAASLEMRDKKKEATFAGNVKVVQGDTTMTSKTLVVFYETFRSSYSYTRIGRIADSAELARALGPGTARITFALH